MCFIGSPIGLYMGRPSKWYSPAKGSRKEGCAEGGLFLPITAERAKVLAKGPLMSKHEEGR